jgi:hypothetical protein
LYLTEFEQKFEKCAGFYARYVDDILIVPQEKGNLPEIVEQANAALNSLELQNKC